MEEERGTFKKIKEIIESCSGCDPSANQSNGDTVVPAPADANERPPSGAPIPPNDKASHPNPGSSTPSALQDAIDEIIPKIKAHMEAGGWVLLGEPSKAAPASADEDYSLVGDPVRVKVALFELHKEAKRADDFETARRALNDILAFDRDTELNDLHEQIDKLAGELTEAKMDLEITRAAGEGKVMISKEELGRLHGALGDIGKIARRFAGRDGGKDFESLYNAIATSLPLDGDGEYEF